MNFEQLVNNSQFAFALMVIAFSVFWYVFVRNPEKSSKKNSNKS